MTCPFCKQKMQETISGYRHLHETNSSNIISCILNNPYTLLWIADELKCRVITGKGEYPDLQIKWDDKRISDLESELKSLD